MSGDDDLFINQVANKGNTAICIHPDAHMTTAAKETFSDWLKQKRRHFSVAPKYKFSHRFLLFLFPACYWLMIISATLSLVFNTSLLLVITPLFLRYLVQFLIFRQSAKWLLNKDLSFLAWFYEALIMVFMPFVALWGMIAKPVTWR
jgi:cellulose synthase/poly-beta-1,6-N-acetylglucosamine synthase-like glycosyltransferase